MYRGPDDGWVTTVTSPAAQPADRPAGVAPADPPAKGRPDSAATKAVLAATVTIVLWASAFVVIRSSGAHLSPGPMALARVAVATLVLTPFVLRGSVRRAGPILPRGWAILPVVGYGALWFAGYNVALNAAEQHV